MKQKRRIWFTADLHLGHRGVLRFGRPWDDVEEMADALVHNWNERVALTDEIYILGDFSLCSRKRTLEYMARLNGTKYLIRGNHDSNQTANLFEWSKDLYRLKIPDKEGIRGAQRIVLCHYPLLSWDQMHYGSWQLHGHSHANLPDDPTKLRLDVGVDANDWRPVSYEEVKKNMQSRPCWPVSFGDDHHQPVGFSNHLGSPVSGGIDDLETYSEFPGI